MKDINELLENMLQHKSIDETRVFLQEFMSENELNELAKRWKKQNSKQNSVSTKSDELSNDVSEEQWQKVYSILGGHIYFQTLSSAVRLDLFSTLKKYGPLSRSEIAKRLKIAEQPARILLLGCCALELIEKVGDSYVNTNVADQLLVGDAPKNIIPIIEWQHYINYKPMFLFYEALKANDNVGLQIFPGEEKTLYERLAHDSELEAIFQNAMQSISVQVNQMLAENVDLSGVNHLVDVGGGDGSNILTLAKTHPKLHASVFDSPTVCKIAQENISNSGLSDRLGTIAGNCFNDPFPDDADCILFCHFFTIWSEDNNRKLLEKCYKDLQDGGRVMIFNMMQDDDESGPLTAAMGSPYFLTLATGEGMLYTWSDYKKWMEEAGFTKIEQIRLPRDHGIITAVKE